MVRSIPQHNREINREGRTRDFRVSVPWFIDPPYLKNNSFIISVNSLAAFLLQEGGAREKLTKENAVRGISLCAESEEASAASSAQAFEKA